MTVIIKMEDGAIKVIENCSGYEVEPEKNRLTVTVNYIRSFFNWSFVQYIGPLEVIGQEESQQ